MNKAQIVSYNSSDYVIKYTISKAFTPNIEVLKDKHTADIAFANQTTIYFGEELKDIEYKEINYKDLPTKKVVANILNDYKYNFTVVDKSTIDMLVKIILHHKPTETEENIIKLIKTEIKNEKQSNIN